MIQDKVKHDIADLKLKKIYGLLQQEGDKLINTLKSLDTQSLDHLQMQSYFLGFHKCFTLVTGVIND